MSGAGATPVLRTCRVGFAALVAPAPGQLRYKSGTTLGLALVRTWTRASTQSRPSDDQFEYETYLSEISSASGRDTGRMSK
jgi:hypothetical protein